MGFRLLAVLLTVILAGLVSGAAELVARAQINGIWRPSGRIMRTSNAFTSSTPISGVDVRVHSRISASDCPQIGLGPSVPCPWNPIPWSQDVTDSGGSFSSDSIAMIFPPFGFDRDLRIEIRDGFIYPNWTEVCGVTMNIAGPTSPTSVFGVNLGDCEVGGFPEGPVDLVPGDEDAEDEPDGKPEDDTVEDPLDNPTLVADPCRFPDVSGFTGPDFAYVPVNISGDYVTADGLVWVEPRPQNDPLNPGLLYVHFRVRNDGGANYAPTRACTALARVWQDEGPGAYAQTGLGTPVSQEEDIDPLSAGQERDMAVAISLRGAPNTFGPPWNTLWPEALTVISVDLDGDRVIPEASEGNNEAGSYCYNASTVAFVPMSECGN